MSAFIESSARFSACLRYRYTLTRTWSAGPRLVFIMLNPSTATAEVSDPTVSRCINRARAMNLAGLEVLNLFAWRSPHPEDLYKTPDPIGPDNDYWIQHILEIAGGPVICAWGDHGLYRDRARKVLQLPTFAMVRTYALGLTKSQCPRHPLYIKSSAEIFPWKGRK